MENVIEEFRKKGISEQDEKVLLELSENNLSKYKRYAQRRLFNEPLSFIKGSVEFFGRDFLVDNRVYIPIKQTEQLVKIVLEDMQDDSVLLDVGTGSGVLAITIKKEKPNIKVYASDLSPNSLNVAKMNAQKHSAEVEFFESLYLDDITMPAPTHIIADLPWGDEVFGAHTLEESKHMPGLAFIHPLGRTKSYEELFSSIMKKGWRPKLFFESGIITEEEISSIIPKGLQWKFLKFENYSVTSVQF
jgi:release factor glutamine methyltransferase